MGSSDSENHPVHSFHVRPLPVMCLTGRNNSWLIARR